MEPAAPEREDAAPRWRPLAASDRRVLGVLIEKAKTTPDAYPLTLNAVRAGSNQKSNRAPAMELEPDEVEESLERLRQFGAVGMVEGYGRVNKYRHYAYEWLGVDKVEAAVMAELLLRGTQTEGELRGRAARMEPLADLKALRPVLASLKSKGLVVSVTPEGRGHLVTHALLEPREMDRVMADHGRSASSPRPVAAAASRTAAPDPSSPDATPPPAATDQQPPDPATVLIDSIRQGLEELRTHVAQLRSDMDDLTGAHRRTEDELRRLREDLGA